MTTLRFLSDEPPPKWKCPECGETSPAPEWGEAEVGCDDCGDHSADVCPRCGEKFDAVHSRVIKELV